MRKTLLAAACLIGLAACGSSKSDTKPADSAANSTTSAANPATSAPASTSSAAKPATTAAKPATSAAASTTTAAKPAGTTAAPATGAAAAVDVTLLEWSIESPVTLKAGEVTFNVKNGGKFPHELAIMKGESYATLPQLANGVVDEAKVGADVLGRTGRIGGGAAETKSFTLAAGNYVLVCNLGGGNNSHAKSGQVLSVKVEA
jgi:hypothetical protein